MHSTVIRTVLLVLGVASAAAVGGVAGGMQLGQSDTVDRADDVVSAGVSPVTSTGWQAGTDTDAQVSEAVRTATGPTDLVVTVARAPTADDPDASRVRDRSRQPLVDFAESRAGVRIKQASLPAPEALLEVDLDRVSVADLAGVANVVSIRHADAVAAGAGSGPETQRDGSGDGPAASTADIVIDSIDYPATVEPDEDLDVGYTLENQGSSDGTESFVDLKVDGTAFGWDDTDSNVYVPAGSTTSGTLTFDEVSEYFAEGDTITFSVELSDFDDTASGETEVGVPDGPADITIDSLDYPETITLDDDLTVDYTLQNEGGEDATESFVDLQIDFAGLADYDSNVFVPAGGTTSGTLTFDEVSEYFFEGDTITFSVELFDFDDTASGQTDIESAEPDIAIDSIDYPATIGPGENLNVEYTLENTGDAAGTESYVDLKVDGTDTTYDDTDTDVTVPAGGTTGGTLTFDEVAKYFDGGDTISFSVELFDFDDTASAQTDIEDIAEPDIVIDSIDFPATIEPGENLNVDYTLSNVGDADGTEPFVDLNVDESDTFYDDTDYNVYVPAGSTTSGTLTFDEVSEYFGSGDTITFSVELWEFGDTASGQTSVESSEPDILIQSVSAPDTIEPHEPLTVDYTLKNQGGADGTESRVDLNIYKTDATNDDTDYDVFVPAGGTASGTLTFDGVSESFDDGDIIVWSVQLSDFGDIVGGTTWVGDSGPPDPPLLSENVTASAP